MRQRNVKNQDEIIAGCDRYIEYPESLKGKWKKEFGYKELRLEIGIGKAKHLYEMAKLYPDVLFVGIELNKGVISLAIKKILRLEKEEGIVCNNLRLFSFNAENLEDIFAEGEVDKLYLNFSDPWPKTRHEKRRLTYKSFLEHYKKILGKDGVIEFKTDNRRLFEFSLVSFNNFNMKFDMVSCDVHKDVEDGKILLNVITEYEEKFSKFGPIYKCIVRF